MSKRRTWVIADDLTGAADSGVAFVGIVGPVRLDLLSGGEQSSQQPDLIVVDTDTRETESAEARRRLACAVSAISSEDVVFKKVDSLMRGPVSSELAELAAALPDRVIVLCPAVPRQNRAVVDGYIQAELADGASLTIGPLEDLLTEIPAHHLVGDTVIELPRALATARRDGTRCLVVDATTDDDLDAIVAAASETQAITWAGAAGLARAVARSLVAGPEPVGHQASAVAHALVVVGSDTEAGRAQGRLLAESGVLTIGLPAVSLALAVPGELAQMSARIATSLARGSVLVTVEGPTDHPARARVARSLAVVIVKALDAADALVVSGGATARSILERAGVRYLELVGEVEHGVVMSKAKIADREIQVVTKSGSFGDGLTLVRLMGAIAKKRG